MRRVLLSSTGIIALGAACPASAQAVIDTRQTTAVRTSTVASGRAGSLRITDKGTVAPAGGTAVTIDSDHGVANAGTIQITGANDAVGILAQAGVRGEIANSGKIVVDETYTPVDTDKDGDLDGPFAQGARRTGIRTAGAFTGTIANSGEITVKGNDSAGIVVGGPLTGAFTHTGKTNVLGDRTTGVALGAVTGAVTLGGTITATGRDAVAARLDGDITGALAIEGAIGATGYRYTTPPASTSKLDADDLLQGGAALIVGGSVTGGILISGATGKVGDIVSSGAAPALHIGSTRAIAIGPVAGTTPVAGLVINGKVTGSGLYGGVAATGLNVGGSGGTVTIAQGIAIGGTVQATALNADATAIRLDTGASVPTIRNSGTIRATATGGVATAIVDRTGTLTLVENGGTIAAIGPDAARSVAIDLSANTGGATIRQIAPATGAAAPSIAGAIRFGSGNDTLDLAAGTVTGAVGFGSGANRLTMTGASTYTGTATFGAGTDTLAIGGTARFSGTADFGGGLDRLTITEKGIFAGRLLNATGLAVTVAPGGGTFAVDGPASIGSLALGAQSILSVALDKTNVATPVIQVGGATSIAAGTQLALRVTGGADVVGRYIVLRSGTLAGAGNLTLASTLVPFMYKGAIVVSTPNEIAVDVLRKAKTELGFNRGQASAFDAIDVALGGDAKVAAAVRGIYDGNAFRAAVDQMLPNYSGGLFESVTLASRATASQLREPAGSYTEEGNWGFWLTPVGWDASKAKRQTSSYDVRGWGIGGGLEHKTAAGNFGASIAYLHGRDSEGVATNRIEHDQYELAGFWRGHWGGFAASVRASAALLSFDGLRRFDGVIGTEKVQRRTTAQWNGMLYSGAGSVSYEHVMGQFNLRPNVALDYYRLNEDAYAETGGGKAVDLLVRKRSSDELALTASLAAGINFGGADRYDQWSRIEIEGGHRTRVAGALGRTTASFAGGVPFTLDPETRDGGWVGKARAVTGTTEVRLSGEVGAERRLGDVALTARAALQFAL